MYAAGYQVLITVTQPGSRGWLSLGLKIIHIFYICGPPVSHLETHLSCSGYRL